MVKVAHNPKIAQVETTWIRKVSPSTDYSINIQVSSMTQQPTRPPSVGNTQATITPLPTKLPSRSVTHHTATPAEGAHAAEQYYYNTEQDRTDTTSCWCFSSFYGRGAHAIHSTNIHTVYPTESTRKGNQHSCNTR